MKFKFWHTLFTVLACLAGVQNALAQGLSFTTNTYPVGSGPYLALGDLNGDGRLDVITGNFNTNTLTILTNNGSGGFGFFATLTVGKEPGTPLAADVNGDGKVGIFAENYGANTITVLTNNGSGNLGSNATLVVGSGPQNIVAVDVNNDGKLDLICANYTSSGTLTVYTNNGSGGFGSNATLNVGSYPPWVCAADINGDGFVDLITTSYKGSNANTLTVLTNNGHGSFGFNASLPVGKEPICVIAADVNGDGKPDLICANNGTNTLTVLTNNGSGVFGFNATLTVNGSPIFVTAADLNGDGKLDLITANGGTFVGIDPGTTHTLSILTNNGSGNFGSNATVNVGNGVDCVLAADLNGDGKPDLVAANFNDNTVTVLLNTNNFPSATNTPLIVIKVQGKNARVSWPSVSSGWSLTETPDLPRTDWLPSGYDGEIIADDGTNKSITLPSSIDNRFFRLLHP